MNPKLTRELLARAGTTARGFRQRKRHELRRLLEAFDKFQIGVAYCPDYDRFQLMRDDLRAMQKSFSVKAWGR